MISRQLKRSTPPGLQLPHRRFWDEHFRLGSVDHRGERRHSVAQLRLGLASIPALERCDHRRFALAVESGWNGDLERTE